MYKLLYCINNIEQYITSDDIIFLINMGESGLSTGRYEHATIEVNRENN